MFKRLMDYSYRRTGAEAFGFYLAYVFMATLVGALAGGVTGAVLRLNAADGFQTGMYAGHMASIALIAFLALALLIKKKLTGSFIDWLLAVAAVVLAVLGGAILGLLPLAYLTTRGAKAGGAVSE